MKLINRAVELRRLSEAWELASQGSPQLVLVTGRRRIGKSFLLGHFAEHRRSVVHVATREAMGQQLASIREQLNSLVVNSPELRMENWHQVFAAAAALATNEPLLFVIDEVPYLHDTDPSWGSVAQAAWDRIAHGPPTKLMIVLTGSSRRVMESLTGGGGPLYGRATVRLRIDAIAPGHVSAFLPKADATRLIEAYAATGGYPMHLTAWDDSASTHSNLVRLASAPGSLLYDNANLILAEEFPGGVGYERVLTSIGMGRRRFGEISSDAGIRIEGPLATLTHIGLVEAERPVGSPRKTRPLYRITDPYLAYWFHVLNRVRSSIELGLGEAALRQVEPLWQGHVAQVFEDIARRHLAALAANGDLDGNVIGRWWGSVEGKQIEIDAVGLEGSDCMFACEVKWQTGPIGGHDIQALAQKANAAFGEHEDRTLVTVARGKLDRRAARPDHQHITAQDLLR